MLPSKHVKIDIKEGTFHIPGGDECHQEWERVDEGKYLLEMKIEKGSLFRRQLSSDGNHRRNNIFGFLWRREMKEREKVCKCEGIIENIKY